MKFREIDPPREFLVGWEEEIRLKDCARIELDPDEQATFISSSGSEFDVARKRWGYYATPSLNGRLRRFHLAPVLVENRIGQFFLLLVERGEEERFQEYLRSERLTVVLRFDDDDDLAKLRSLREE